MVSMNIPSRNERSFEELAQQMFGQSTSTEVELVSLKILVNALSVILLDKGICSRKEIQQYTEDALKVYQTLKKLDDKLK